MTKFDVFRPFAGDRKRAWWLAGLIAVGIAGGPTLRAQGDGDAIAPKSTINLMGDPAFKDFTMSLNQKRSLTTKREEIWSIAEDGRLHVSGKGWGYLRTNAKYRDYHLVLEYQWGEHTWGTRADAARDCGLLVHGFGEDGAYADTWMNSIEAQLIEGGSGDILVLAYQNRGEEKAPTSLTATVKDDRDGEPVWTPGGESRVFPGPGKMNARINCKYRDPDWADVKGFRGPADIENPVGEWNRLEVICRGDNIRILLNGELVNEGTKANPSEGFICLQSEAAECWIRRYELWPLDTFDEKWEVEKRSTDTGYTATGESILPRRLPYSPEESQAAWEIDGDYEMQLVACEPLTCDPVDVVWDEQGRMFVAEMRDYPLPPEDGPLLSRIRLLKDTDGDGRMDEAVTWADELDHVQGLLPMQGGLLATTRTAILFLKDTDGDEKADQITPLYISNEPRHNQLQVSCPRWGLDNAVYLNNGLDGKQIYPAEHPDQTVDFTRLNLRYDPYAKTVAPLSGAGQFGGSLDDWGRRFFCSNRNPVMFAVMPLDALGRNPAAGITSGQEDIQEPGAKVWPVNLSHTTSAAHAGTHTAACGLGVYRGSWLPDLTGNIFVCDPTAQLVTRNRLEPRGGSFEAVRVGDHRDFLVSADEWTRPVNVRNGPDGALYVCDMYRRFIDHARFFPEEFSKTNYMRAGFDHGRIWRLAPKGAKPKKIEPLPDDSASLVTLLESPDSWKRIHAQRLLIERQAKDVAPVIAELLANSKSPQGRVHALWTLHGLGELTDAQIAAALDDPEEGVVENAIRLADPGKTEGALEKVASGGMNRAAFLALIKLGSGHESTDIAAMANGGLADPWMRKAVLSAEEPPSAAVVAAILDRQAELKTPAAALAEFLEDFVAEIAALGDLAGMGEIASRIKADQRDLTDIPIVEGLADGLRRSKLPTKTLAALLSKTPEQLVGKLDGVKAVLDGASEIALDREAPAVERVAALSLVQQQGMEATFPVVEKLIDPAETPEVQSAACQALSRFDRNKVADFFFDRWKTLAPTPRREALDLIAGNPNTGLRLMQKMKAGEISKALMPPMQRWSYARSTNEEVKNLAIELFGQASGDRGKVINDYKGALAGHEGDAERGKAVFQKAACMTCHQLKGVGVEVGPSLADVRIKPPEALLTDILDPNRAVEERWAAYTIETKDGRQLAGLVAAETDAAIEIRLPGGLSETVPRDQVAKYETTGLSLMPVGLEAAISHQDMADLIAFLKAR
ncbi:MAG: DUF1080 domain-containing protein [Verrucomicrobiae bacterium]|nr:DUF1080 domain-containing protein [Verrucomicrobiae bacterium]